MVDRLCFAPPGLMIRGLLDGPVRTKDQTDYTADQERSKGRFEHCLRSGVRRSNTCTQQSPCSHCSVDRVPVGLQEDGYGVVLSFDGLSLLTDKDLSDMSGSLWRQTSGARPPRRSVLLALRPECRRPTVSASSSFWQRHEVFRALASFGHCLAYVAPSEPLSRS